MFRRKRHKILPMNVSVNETREFNVLFVDLLKDCEVRAGLKTDLWLKMVRAGKVREHQVEMAFLSTFSMSIMGFLREI